MCLFLFGYETAGYLKEIQELTHYAQSSRVLPLFLRQACDVVQLEVSRLPLNSEQRRNIGRFDTILRLAEHNAGLNEPNEVIEMVLMTIARLGSAILFCEEDPTLTSHVKPTHILGFGIGEVPAAVVAVARDVYELVDLATEATKIVFRLAVELSRRSMMIDQTRAPWSRRIIGIPRDRVQEILDEFHEKKLIPRSQRVCVGHVFKDHWQTLFGPPSVLERLPAWSGVFRDASSTLKNEVRVGMHMESLPELDIETIIGYSPSLWSNIPASVTLLSPYTCRPRESRALRELLKEIISDMGQRPMYVEDSVKAVAEAVEQSDLRVVIPGVTEIQIDFAKAMRSRGLSYLRLRHGQDIRSSTAQRKGSNLIAVVGMSGRFPGSGNVKDFWENLLQGKRFVQEIPDSRFNLDKWYDSTGKQKNSTSARTGAFLDKPGMFDNRLFNMSPREAMQTDVQHRLLLTTSYEALEMAGYSPDSTPSTNRDRISSYFGQTSDDWRQIVFNEGADIYYGPGNCRAFGPGRLHHHFKWGGSHTSVDTACASSISAISMACSDLLNRQCDMALAGGGSIIVSPAPFSGLSRGGFLSTHRGCETFMDNADGYARGEGIGVVVLKRLEDALEDHDNILGLIRGFGRNFSSDAPSITRPSVAAQKQLYRHVLEKSNTDPHDIAYVEMHGTGTQAGDELEMSSVLSTFAVNREPSNPLIVGALKASIGHGEAASGVCALIKTLMILRTHKIPPQPDLPGPINSKFPDLAALNVHIARGGMDLSEVQKSSDRLRMFLNCFDASGGNSCLLLEEAPLQSKRLTDPRPQHIIAISARSKKSLAGIKERYLTYLQQNQNIRLADFAYSTTARRMHHPLRYAIAASSVEEAVSSLKDNLAQNTTPRAAAIPPDVVFVFTGQGSYYKNMGYILFTKSLTFQKILSGYQDIASAQGLPKFLDLISTMNLEPTDTEPDAIRVQLALLCLELGLAELWRLWGVEPVMVIGHSLGEYAALCVAGVISVSDALHLVGSRAKMVSEELRPGQFGMLAIAQDAQKTSDILAGGYVSSSIACINAPNMTVVSGPLPEIEKLQAHLDSQGIQHTLLPLSHGFHSSQLDPILKQFEDVCQSVSFSAPKIPIASSLLGTVVTDEGTFSPSYLVRQSRECVNFVGALHAIQRQNFINVMFLEIGPDPICLGFISATFGVREMKNRCFSSIQRGSDDWKPILSTLRSLYVAGLEVDWTAYHLDFKSCLSLVDLPFYAFDEKEFWLSFPDPDPESRAVVGNEKQTPAIVPSVKGYPTTTLQRIVNESIEGNTISVTFESSLLDRHLREAIRGHVLVGADTCASSFLMDIALSAAQYAYQKDVSGRSMNIPITVQNNRYHQALVLTEEDQTLVVDVKLATDKNIADVRYRCRTLNDQYELGACQIVLGSIVNLNQSDFLVRSRMMALKALADNSLGRRVVYRLFENVVLYSAPYQGLEKVYLGDGVRDAVGDISMRSVTCDSGHYLHNPFLLDAVTHLSGFVLNNGLHFSNDIAFVATGFDTWHLSRPLHPGFSYTSYTYSENSPMDNDTIKTNVYVYEGDELVSVLAGIRFQKMKKATLQQSLSVTSGSRMGSNAPARAKKPEIQAFDPPIISSNTSAGDSQLREHTSVSLSNEMDLDPGTKFLRIVAREVGIDQSELEDDVRFGSLGLDSLMAITIISVMHQETGIELPGTLFLRNPTVRSVVLSLNRNWG